MSDTVLIAAADLLGRLSQHEEFSAALAFPDSDAAAALEAIVSRRPRLVALEKLFASSARGAALIDRIRTDPSLTACEIRIIAHDAERLADTDASSGAAPAPDAASPPPLDQHGTRSAPRFDMPADFAVVLDGRPARLIDLSIGGAQVSAMLAMKPGQRIRLALPADPRPLRLSGVVQWATFEMPKEGPRYRAGLRFLDADADAVTAFIDAHKTA